MTTYPLDPRTVECPEWGAAIAASKGASCKRCRGTGRVPLKPEPTVEVWEDRSMPSLKRWQFKVDGTWVKGAEHGEASALRAARLAWLGVTLEGPDEDGEWAIENVCGFGTADQAIEAAFAARDGEGKR